MTGDSDTHFVEELEERENASLAMPTLVDAEDGGYTTMACFETGCGGWWPPYPYF
jgi:hypothetical protein